MHEFLRSFIIILFVNRLFIMIVVILSLSILFLEGH